MRRTHALREEKPALSSVDDLADAINLFPPPWKDEVELVAILGSGALEHAVAGDGCSKAMRVAHVRSVLENMSTLKWLLEGDGDRTAPNLYWRSHRATTAWLRRMADIKTTQHASPSVVSELRSRAQTLEDALIRELADNQDFADSRVSPLSDERRSRLHATRDRLRSTTSGDEKTVLLADIEQLCGELTDLGGFWTSLHDAQTALPPSWTSGIDDVCGPGSYAELSQYAHPLLGAISGHDWVGTSFELEDARLEEWRDKGCAVIAGLLEDYAKASANP